MAISLRWFGAKKNLIPLLKIESPLFVKPWVPFTRGSFVPSLFENGQVLMEKKIFKLFQLIFAISYYLSLKNVMALHLNKLAFSSPTDALCQVGFKMAERFWSSRFLYLHFLKKVQEYCCYPCPSVRMSVQRISCHLSSVYILSRSQIV